MAEQRAIEFAGSAFVLDADRALVWPAQRRLVIADLHLGKGDIFRNAGIAVPTGGTAHDIARLARLLQRHAPRAVWILGDVVHGTPTQASTFTAAFRELVTQWPEVEFGVIPGNHDRALDAASLGVILLPDVLEEHGILFAHDAQASQRPVISGHVHPVIRLRGEVRQSPVFWQRRNSLILPAFSLFTGGHRVRPAGDEILHACNGESIVALPAPAA